MKFIWEIFGFWYNGNADMGVKEDRPRRVRFYWRFAGKRTLSGVKERGSIHPRHRPCSHSSSLQSVCTGSICSPPNGVRGSNLRVPHVGFDHRRPSLQ